MVCFCSNRVVDAVRERAVVNPPSPPAGIKRGLGNTVVARGLLRNVPPVFFEPSPRMLFRVVS